MGWHGMTKPTVFISYSHKDKDWKDRIVTHLGVLQQEGLLDVWDDRRIGGGEDWYPKIEEAIKKASVAILLISANFLTSNFILKEEIPRLLELRAKKGMRIFPVVIKPCAWNQVKWLSQMNLRPEDGKPMSGGNEHLIDTDLTNVANEVAEIINSFPEKENEKGLLSIGPQKISLAKLPSSNPELFGRDKELEMLSEAWKNPKTNIVSLVAWGGVGKTALVNKWLSVMRDEHHCGAEFVYGWSFYSHGAAEGKQVSTDFFITSALDFFGDEEPDNGTHWEKAERLANLIKKNRTLLILDGLEPLQNPPGEEQGRIKDPVIKYLLRELAHHNTGLCIITTRLEVDDLKEFEGTTLLNKTLEHLSPEAGATLLENFGVQGTSEELKEAVSEFGGHALALTLLGGYLKVVYNGDVRQRDKIEILTKEKKNGGHARRVMESYEKWFKGKPELNILRIMGLFDSSAEGGAIEALKAEPPIESLTSGLTEVSDEDWRYALNTLRDLKIFAKVDTNKPDTLDCHPLIREHFGEKLKERNPTVWKEANTRLYHYYRDQSKEFPETLEEMLPLFAAIAHGCEGGHYQEVFNEIYWRRISKKNEHYITTNLGAYGSDLALISNFFIKRWKKPVDDLTNDTKIFILGSSGFCLRAIGRLDEAIQPMLAGLGSCIEAEAWSDAARSAQNLSELYLILGNITEAQNYAEKNIDFGSRSHEIELTISSNTTLANTLFHSGKINKALNVFRKAELIHKKKNRKSFLYSTDGFQYCDLLLNQGKYPVVLTRAHQTIKVFKGACLSIALDYLSLGKAFLVQALHEESSNFSQAKEHLNKAIEELRQFGGQEFTICGLLARTKLYIASDDIKNAKRDLDEAFTLAERSGMKLYQADCHLEYARLNLAIGKKEEAGQNLVTAKEMVEKMGYHLRDQDVLEIEELLRKL